MIYWYSNYSFLDQYFFEGIAIAIIILLASRASRWKEVLDVTAKVTVIAAAGTIINKIDLKNHLQHLQMMIIKIKKQKW